MRRFWRLYPPYLAALVIALGLHVVGSGGLPVSSPAVVAQALLVHTFHPATFDGVNPPAWSLAVEAQLYAVYPIAFWLIVRRGALRALAVVLGVTLAYRVALNFDPLPSPFGGVAWEFFLARWFEWVLGAVIAEWAVGRVRLPRIVVQPWLAATVFGLGVLLEWHRWHYGLYALMEPVYGVAFALLLCVVLRQEARGQALRDRSLPRRRRAVLVQPVPAPPADPARARAAGAAGVGVARPSSSSASRRAC